MAESEIRIEFAGPAVDNGQMTARWVGQTLVAMSDLVSEVKRTDSSLERATTPELLLSDVDHNSFDLSLVVQALGDLWEQMRELATGQDVTALANMTAVVGLVFASIKRIGGRRVREHATTEDGETVELILDDGTKALMPTEAFVAFMNARVRRAARRVVEPVEREGINSVRIIAGPQPAAAPVWVEVTKEDVDSFRVEDPQQPPEDSAARRTARVQPVSVDFERERWRVSEGGASFTAKVEDEDFLRQLDRGEISIGKTDIFEVGLRVEQSVGSDGKLQVKTAIERVISQDRGIVQPEIDLDAPEG